MTVIRSHFYFQRKIQRLVSNLAVLGILSAALFASIHQCTHLRHHGAVPIGQLMVVGESVSDYGHDPHKHPSASPSIANYDHLMHDHTANGSGDPASTPDHSSDVSDCSCCCALHCFACVVPVGASVVVPWTKSKKEAAVGLFSAPPPSWRLERPPKIFI